MGVRVLALASGVTTLEDHRLALSGMVASAGPLANRGGLLPAAGAADLTTVSAMQCTVAPCRVWVPGRSNALQGGYLFVADAETTITIGDGEASVDRTDRIGAVVHDDVYDASGQHVGELAYLRGQPTGQPVAWPDSYVPLYELTVPAGASAATGGVDFSTATDLRAFTAAAGGLVNVADLTERGTITTPYPAMPIWRRDLSWIEVWDGSAWRVVSQIIVPSLSALTTAITDPYEGQIAYVASVDQLYIYSGTDWQPYAPELPSAKLICTNANQDFADSATVAVKFSSAPIDNLNGWDGDDTYVVQRHGLYEVSGNMTWGAFSGGYRQLYTTQNGQPIDGSQGSSNVIADPGVHVTPCSSPRQLISAEAGDTIQMMAWQNSGGAISVTGNVTSGAQFRPTLNVNCVSVS